ncbi:UDP-N-acetylmuramoyl-L-alanyl-D-glutamate--2,6-diaminopimelate ligase [Rhodovibrionaceae bacterium A322]
MQQNNPVRLSELLKGSAMSAEAENFEITGLTADSRQVTPGCLFAALPGSQVDGRDFIDQAVNKGAIAVLAPEGTRLKSYDHPVLLICDQDPRHRLAAMAASYYKRQPRQIAAVTGTNGKTSVACFTSQLWELLGLKAASLGTLGLQPELPGAPNGLTTPDPVELMRCLADVAEAGFDHLAMEASSHGLDQARLDGVRVSAAAFTNLSRDHLDYHGDMASYLEAKKALFSRLLPEGGVAVLNADAPEFEELANLCRGRGQQVVSYGFAGQDLKLLALTPTAGGLQVSLDLFGEKADLLLPLAGSFQAHNVLAAVGLVLAESRYTAADLIPLLPSLTGVPGRAELVGNTPSGGHVYVDYSHTPASLEVILEALRPHTENNLVVVYGAGGDRDPGKRPMMGAACERLADRAIITDDNPRSEDPASIRAAIRDAAPSAEEIGDRQMAIEAAIAGLGPGDTLVIAGKGHETGQTVRGKVLPFDDRVVARAILYKLQDAATQGDQS